LTTSASGNIYYNGTVDGDYTSATIYKGAPINGIWYYLATLSDGNNHVLEYTGPTTTGSPTFETVDGSVVDINTGAVVVPEVTVTAAPRTGSSLPGWLLAIGQWSYDNSQEGMDRKYLPSNYFSMTPPNNSYAFDPKQPVIAEGAALSLNPQFLEQPQWRVGVLGGAGGVVMQGTDNGGVLMQRYVQYQGGSLTAPNDPQTPGPGELVGKPASPTPLFQAGFEWTVSDSIGAFNGPSYGGSLPFGDTGLGGTMTFNQYGKNFTLTAGLPPAGPAYSNTSVRGPVVYVPFEQARTLLAPYNPYTDAY
jgi:hypothetical protein